MPNSDDDSRSGNARFRIRWLSWSWQIVRSQYGAVAVGGAQGKTGFKTSVVEKKKKKKFIIEDGVCDWVC